MKHLLIGGTALAMLAAVPALASSEIETTRQLNLQAARAAAPSQPSPADKAAQAMPPSAAPTMPVQTAAETPLSEMRNPPRKIAIANVLDSSGTIVGAVQKVEVSPQGQPTKVAVALLGKGDKLVVLDADSVTYDPAKNEIQSTGNQIKAEM